MEKEINVEYVGGFSKELWNNTIIQEYLKKMNPPAGWIGHDVRTNELDYKIETSAKSLKMSNEELARFITSKQGRLLGDRLSNPELSDTNKEKIISKALETFKESLDLEHLRR